MKTGTSMRMIPLTANQREPAIFMARSKDLTSIHRRIIMKQILLLTVLATAVCVTPLTAQAQEDGPGLSVAESKLGKDVIDREIVNEASTFGVDERVYLWMRITGGPADSVTVTWSIGDDTWSTNLNVGASTWRTWAYRTAWKAGDWKVTVTDVQGKVLLQKDFTVTP
jgi:hypothetical protein